MATPSKGCQKFSYCELCRHSHDRGKRHAFSRGHRDKVKTILEKFGAKVKSARQDMKEPPILTGHFQPDSKYWCYMCACEVDKHVTDGEVTVRHAGFIEHLMSAEHAQRLDRFWRINRIQTDLQTKFVFPNDARDRYKKAVEEALRKYEENEEHLLSQSAAKIRRLERSRSLLLQSDDSLTTATETTEILAALSQQPEPNAGLDSEVMPSNPSGIRRTSEAGSGAGNRLIAQDVPGCSHWSNGTAGETQGEGAMLYLNQQDPAGNSFSQCQQAVNQSPAAGKPPHKPGVLSRVRTIGVISSGGLTAVHVKDRGVKGNVHTGAQPPWLQGDNDDDDNVDAEEEAQKMMGPSELEFRKHVERERKSKLNPGRVGANFDHASPTNEAWLPSFGRVWNAGRRWQSRRQYRKEAGQFKPCEEKNVGCSAKDSKLP
ncbi:coiled-coil domain-containing protein 84-like [Acanthaster planci]|uniref:Coiled-coil domain-containing protein 84-like n=1 Tax=Acanthaster planci TaxID=133434 RepID=A0A8B7ZDN0_ACAPL|nr:coiled-coil domain-containing protein 84-like [Acanthaster planci]